MPKEDKKETTGTAVVNSTSGAVSKPQLLRVSTIVKNNGVDSMTAAAVMTANRLRSGNRIEPVKFLKMVDNFRQRKIRKIGGIR